MAQCSLYSATVTLPIEFVRVHAATQGGEELGNVFKRCLPNFIQDGRYRDLFPVALDAERRSVYRQAIEGCARGYDRRYARGPEERLAVIELDFRELILESDTELTVDAGRTVLRVTHQVGVAR
ncbi:MAG: hypothetical protein ACI8TX_000270 [Hyphomicrobiaceae bacterium]|jgi:hypothetical protein